MTSPGRPTFLALSKVPFPTSVLATSSDSTRDEAVEMLRCAFDHGAAISDLVTGSDDWHVFEVAKEALDFCQQLVLRDGGVDCYADSCLEAARLLEEGWTP